MSTETKETEVVQPGPAKKARPKGNDGTGENAANLFHCESCEKDFTENPRATDDGYWLCDPCYDGLMNEPETLTPKTHYATLKKGDPICLGFYKVSTDSKEVDCENCLSVIEQRRSMDMGDWLK